MRTGYIQDCINEDNLLISYVNCNGLNYLTALIGYEYRERENDVHINVLLSDLNINTIPSDILYLLKLLYERIDKPLTLDCLPHNCLYYTMFGFKFEKRGQLVSLVWNPPPLEQPRLSRDPSITKNSHNIRKKTQVNHESVTIFRHNKGEHIIINSQGFVKNVAMGGYKKEFINVKGFGKRLLRYTKNNRRYVMVHKKRKYLD